MKGPISEPSGPLNNHTIWREMFMIPISLSLSLVSPMSKLPEIIDLFARLASSVQTVNSPSGNVDQSIDFLVSNLNQSLNLREHSRVRVLDTTLSLLCFTAPQVFDSVLDYSVKTIVSVLSSSVHCKVLRFGKEEVFRVGGSISSHDCQEVIEACADILGKMKEYGTLSSALLYAVLRVAASATRFRHLFLLTPVLEVKCTDKNILALSELFCHIPKRISLKSQEIPLRLLSWHLDPHTLKHDVSQLLHEATRRPFICLSVELHERMEWRSIIVCMVLSPVMFVEIRSLLHNWGLASVLELQIEFASSVEDVLFRPMWWGISAEVGSKLPFSHAYFPDKHKLFSTFAVPLSCEGFLQLAHSIRKSLSQGTKYFRPTRNHTATACSMVDQKSLWFMAMTFPDWFYLASVLLFFGESFFSSFQDNFRSEVIENKQPHCESPSCFAAASRYIAWVLNPISEPHQNFLAECLNKLSGSLPVKQSSANKHNKAASAYKKKLKKPKLDSQGDETFLKEYDCQSIRLWLKEFQDMYISYHNVSAESFTLHELETSQGFEMQQNLLCRRVSLGILIGCPNALNDDECELVLHYASSGTILPPTENEIAGLKHRRWNCEQQENYNNLTDNLSRKAAIAGACTIFHLTDIVERMSTSLFETEEIGVDFICRVKLRAGGYLLKCIKRLLLDIDQDVPLMLKDLYNRLLRWRHQGKDVLQSYKDLDDVIDAIKSKLSSL